MFCIFTCDRGLRFWSGLLVSKFTAAVGVFTWAYFLRTWCQAERIRRNQISGAQSPVVEALQREQEELRNKAVGLYCSVNHCLLFENRRDWVTINPASLTFHLKCFLHVRDGC